MPLGRAWRYGGPVEVNDAPNFSRNEVIKMKEESNFTQLWLASAAMAMLVIALSIVLAQPYS
jgi:hypothetical protein